ncbi:MFS transporter [Pleurocapsales cyanobacterium LEGE 06147]|nr:MFS transporter [Pleurocapsales cyanobacterium LEGE 06147]
MESVPVEIVQVECTNPPDTQEISQDSGSETTVNLARPYPRFSKNELRTSLQASTIDGIFAAIFSNIAGGVLLSNFLVQLDAGAIAFGMLSSIPMLVNLLQPWGARLSERTNSRQQYCLWIYGSSRLLWLILAVGIAIASWQEINSNLLIAWTLTILFISHVLGALGSASWMSWLATIVPRRLRGRYFGLRNSAASLTVLITMPLLGLLVSKWRGGSFQGYGVVLAVGVVAGLLSLGCQFFMTDVNPQLQQMSDRSTQNTQSQFKNTNSRQNELINVDSNPLRDKNFSIFLLYFGMWMFAVNVSAPFLNLYLLDTLNLDVSWVTFYSALMSGAHLLMMLLWGRLADRIGNRPLLFLLGILASLLPLLWLGTDINPISIWLWLPLLHLFRGGTWAALDLCSQNIQLEIAPKFQQSTYFAIAAAIAGVSGALGTTLGGFLAQWSDWGGLSELFIFSTFLRLVALIPLIFLRERQGQSLKQMMRVLLPSKFQATS